MANYQIMSWKHIPSQVKAWDGEAEVKRMLPDYFQAAIDAYAMKDGSTEMDSYLDGWKWGPVEVREGTPDSVVSSAISQQLVTAMLRISAEDSSARVGAWNLRDIAAHLAATERECYKPRIRAIASGENPSFDIYTNDDTDFSGIQLENALDEWSASRERLI